MKYFTLVIVALLGWATAQDRAACGSHMEVDPAYTGTVQYQNEALRYNQYLEKQSLNKTNTTPTRILYPAVVHVVHTGPSSADSISVAQVKSMFDLLHKQLRQVPGTPYHGGLGVDSYIEFELATKDPNGDPTTGVNYIRNSTYSNLNKDIHNDALKGLIYWEPEQYVNIWVVRTITDNASSPIAGYAQFPEGVMTQTGIPMGSTYDFTDGIVVIHNDFGTIGSATTEFSSTTVHEFGHWLALFHTFQGGCAPSCTTTGDWVCDTPPVINQKFKNPSARLNSCVSDSPDRPDLPRNYMDYTAPAEQQSLFTQGQLNRIRYFIEQQDEPRRYNPWQEANHEACGIGKWGTLVPFFWANNRNTYVGQPVTFKDYTRNIPTSYTWTFGGNPTVDNTNPAAPVATWSTPGTYDVTLSVTNNAGTWDTTLVNFITVTGTAVTLPISEGFSGSFPPAGWVLENPDEGKNTTTIGNGVTWTRSFSSNATSGSGGAVRLLNANNYDIGQRDMMRLPYIDLTSINCARMSFALNYQPVRYEDLDRPETPSRGVIYADTLKVEGSLDGGTTWQTLYVKGGLDLMTSSNVALTSDSAYLGNTNAAGPTGYRRDTVYLPKSYMSKVALLRLVNVNGYGGNLFLDDVKVEEAPDGPSCWYTATTGVKEAKYASIVYPNPTTGASTLRIQTNADMTLNATLRDVNGRVVREMGTLNLQVGLNTVTLPTTELPAGVYLLHLQGDGGTQVTKIMKY